MYTSRPATPQKSAKPKKNFMTFINNVVRKVFNFFRMIIHLAWAIIDNGMQLIIFFFSYLVKILSNPITPCVISILAFATTVAIAALQWYQIGIWLGRMLQFRSIYGIAAGVAGVLLGTGINVYQLAPTLWKIRKDVARAYAELGVDTEFDPDEETVKAKQQHWLSFDHGLLKKTRLISYGIETGLVLGFVFLNGLNFFAIIASAIAVRTLNVKYAPSHPVDTHIGQVACECDF